MYLDPFMVWKCIRVVTFEKIEAGKPVTSYQSELVCESDTRTGLTIPDKLEVGESYKFMALKVASIPLSETPNEKA